MLETVQRVSFWGLVKSFILIRRRNLRLQGMAGLFNVQPQTTELIYSILCMILFCSLAKYE